MLKTVLFVSRNKDNQDLEGFKERRRTYLIDSSDDQKFRSKFLDFVSEGVKGEFCRYYESFNVINPNKLRKLILTFLIQNDDYPLDKLNAKVCGLANTKDAQDVVAWLWDFDSKDEEKLHAFKKDIFANWGNVLGVQSTVSGYAVITSKFDSREVENNWKDIVQNKKSDAMLFVTCAVNDNN